MILDADFIDLFSNPDFRKVVKLPVSVHALQINADDGFEVETGHGRVKAKQGDYLMIGVNGEKYPCEREVFEKTYRDEKALVWHPWTEELSNSIDECKLMLENDLSPGDQAYCALDKVIDAAERQKKQEIEYYEIADRTERSCAEYREVLDSVQEVFRQNYNSDTGVYAEGLSEKIHECLDKHVAGSRLRGYLQSEIDDKNRQIIKLQSELNTNIQLMDLWFPEWREVLKDVLIEAGLKQNSATELQE